MVIILELRKWKKSDPIILSLIDKELEVLLQFLVNQECLVGVENAWWRLRMHDGGQECLVGLENMWLGVVLIAGGQNGCCGCRIG